MAMIDMDGEVMALKRKVASLQMLRDGDMARITRLEALAETIFAKAEAPNEKPGRPPKAA